MMARKKMETEAAPASLKRYRKKKLKLIYNPSSGQAKLGNPDLEAIMTLLQKYRFETEVFMVEPGADLETAVQAGLADGVDLFVACGGDGTSSRVSRLLVGTKATLGIIPRGTQNNSALAYEIPQDLEAAIRVLREGRKLKADIGLVILNGKTSYFVEVCSVGLVSDLFPSADDIQHGKIHKIGELVSTLASKTPSEFEIQLEPQNKTIKGPGFVLLASNMPVIGFNYHLGRRSAMQDGKLDLMFFQDISKMQLLSYVLKGMGDGLPSDERIRHILAEKISIKVEPKMTVMCDDRIIGEGDLELSVLKHAITVMIPKRSRVKQSK